MLKGLNSKTLPATILNNQATPSLSFKPVPTQSNYGRPDQSQVTRSNLCGSHGLLRASEGFNQPPEVRHYLPGKSCHIWHVDLCLQQLAVLASFHAGLASFGGV